MTARAAASTMNFQPGEAAMADRGALGTIGLLLGAATLLVTITAAVVVGGYRGGAVRSAANLPAAAAAATATR
jgi:hypothetical protein